MTAPVTADGVRALVRAHLPRYRAGSVVPLGHGIDHTAWSVDGELVVRFSHESGPEAAAAVEREARLLAVVRDAVEVPVPRLVLADAEHGVMAYPLLPGVPLLDVTARNRHAGAVGAALGRLLAALHAVPRERVAGLVDVDAPSMAEWLTEARDDHAAVTEHVPGPARAAVAGFLATSPPRGSDDLVLSHNDLGVEHVLVDPGTGDVTGVIDWSDAALVDPATDFGLLYRDLGPHVLAGALATYAGADAGLRERALFYGRCSVFEELVHGVRAGREAYVTKSLTAMEWLFR